jgi:hypothetical protein
MTMAELPHALFRFENRFGGLWRCYGSYRGVRMSSGLLLFGQVWCGGSFACQSPSHLLHQRQGCPCCAYSWGIAHGFQSRIANLFTVMGNPRSSSRACPHNKSPELQP